MNSYNGLPASDWTQMHTQEGRRPLHGQQPLTLSPQLLFLNPPTTSQKAQSSPTRQFHDARPMPWEDASYEQFRRESVALNVSMRSSSASRRHGSESPTGCRIETKGSPAPSSASSSESRNSAVSSHIADLHEMSGAPFCGSFAGIFGLTTECLACGYRYDSVHELADHQRMVHGMADVVF